MIVLGLDRVPSQVKKFAAVIVAQDGRVLWRGEVRAEEIPDIIRRFHVSAIALDNLWELFSSPAEVREFMRRCNVRVFKSTGPPWDEKKLSYLAKQFGLHSGGKLSPEEAAEVSARLVLMGIATEVIAFELSLIHI